MKQTVIFSDGIQWLISGRKELHSWRWMKNHPYWQALIKCFCMECILLHRVHHCLPLIKPDVISISTFLENMHLHEIIPQKCHYTAIHSNCTESST